MNENLNLCKILKDCPKGTKLYCTFLGDVLFSKIEKDKVCISFGCYAVYSVYSNGQFSRLGECVLFPSRDQRDWSKFKVPVKKFDPTSLKPFDKVLIRNHGDGQWVCDFFSDISIVNKEVHCVGMHGYKCIPYNDETKHLVGTSEDCYEYYKWWEE